MEKEINYKNHLTSSNYIVYVIYPSNADCFYNMDIDVKLHLGKYEEVIEYCSKFYKNKNKYYCIEAIKYAVWAYMELGKYKKADTLLRKGIKIIEKDYGYYDDSNDHLVDFFIQKMLLNIGIGTLNEALESINKAIDISSKQECYIYKTDLLIKMELYKEAYECNAESIINAPLIGDFENQTKYFNTVILDKLTLRMESK